ncbi:MAG: tetratricopeptide repeat protein [Gemmataceae bacterium]|nr:tetratricopeptide repeat protein [Gemmataceae bacterium]MDW8263890.1 tetratricopeptide repeat protein [Gemmataceae bacterium]
MTARLFVAALVAAAVLSMQPGPVAAQPGPADRLLESARQARNERNYTAAAQRYRDFLNQHANHPQATAARLELAVTLVERPDKDYPGAEEQLKLLAEAKESADDPRVWHYRGWVQRALGMQAAGSPAATRHWDDAARHLAQAANRYQARLKADPASAADRDGAARALGDQADVLLRAGKPREAQAVAGTVLRDPTLSQSRHRDFAQYEFGVASFVLGDRAAAFRALNVLAPFADPVWGTHAEYLVARIHHADDEWAEALLHYDGVLNNHQRLRQEAAELRKRGEFSRLLPDERARIEALLQQPPPDHVARAAFYGGMLHYQAGRFAEAATRFAVAGQAASPIQLEAELRRGMCLVQLKQLNDAIKVLSPLVERAPRLAAVALLWLARAEVAAVDLANPAAAAPKLQAAADRLRRAAESLPPNDSTAEVRELRSEILRELGDVWQLARRPEEAAKAYGQLVSEKLPPHREAEILERYVTALHLAGDFAGSDRLAAEFQKRYPRSLVLASVLFRHAENAYIQAVRAGEAGVGRQLADEALRRYQRLLDRYPDFPHAALARYRLGVLLYRQGQFDKAKELFEAIPVQDRTGELAGASFLLVDCVLRSAPARADDALAAGQLQEALQTAIGLLDGFVASEPNGPKQADGLIKLGYCYQRLAELLADPKDKSTAWNNAVNVYVRIRGTYPNTPVAALALFERCKSYAGLGDRARAVTDLRRFLADPLRLPGIAPMALLRLATYLREESKPEEAAKILADCLTQYEPTLKKDSATATWVPLLRYHLAAALMDSGKLSEAAAAFEDVAREAAGSSRGFEAQLRAIQCGLQRGRQDLDAIRAKLGPTPTPDQLAGVRPQLEANRERIGALVHTAQKSAEKLRAHPEHAEVRARLLYEAAWGYRLMAESTAEPKPVRPPASKPVDRRALALYQALIADHPDLPVTGEARAEYAELLARQGEVDAAQQLLGDALDKEPPPETTERIRLVLGACLMAKGKVKEAMGQLELVARNPKSPHLAQAQYRLGECSLLLNDPGQAIARWSLFRDQPALRQVAGLSDRALLRLGWVQLRQGQWDQGRQAFEQLLERHGPSPWLADARYGIGFARQQQKQLDEAVNQYQRVVALGPSGAAGKAQLQIGLCRLEQKRWAEAAKALVEVPALAADADLAAAALCEAARAQLELKQPAEAEKLLRRVLSDYPTSPWATVARERLKQLNPG